MTITYIVFMGLVAMMSVTLGLFHFWWIGQRATASYVVITSITIIYTLLAIRVVRDEQTCTGDFIDVCRLFSGLFTLPGGIILHFIGIPFQYRNFIFMSVAITLTQLLAWLGMMILHACIVRVRGFFHRHAKQGGTLMWIKHAARWIAQTIVATLAGMIGSCIIGYVVGFLTGWMLDTRNHRIDGEGIMVIALGGPFIGLLMGLVGSLSGTWRRGLLSSLSIWGFLWDYQLLSSPSTGRATAGGPSVGALLWVIMICTIIAGSAGALSGWLREAWKAATSEPNATHAHSINRDGPRTSIPTDATRL